MYLLFGLVRVCVKICFVIGVGVIWVLSCNCLVFCCGWVVVVMSLSVRIVVEIVVRVIILEMVVEGFEKWYKDLVWWDMLF